MEIFETTARAFDARYERQAATHQPDIEEPEYGRIKRVWDVEPIPPEEIAAILTAARAAAVAANNTAAGNAREAYLTAVPGQATTYAAKQAETQRWIEAGRLANAAAATYPWAGDRADLRAVTVSAVLAEWEAVTAAWEVVGRRIERERERVNEAIGAADTLEAIQAARDSAAYPAP
ncbi:hypothetical protein ABNQ38_36655 (plasmid) [Azospirillum sp. A29]|jgi:hypothetical protein|uniref:hypothetical protein n=1 Tax=Azospirillum sp. A29 TaxID=3160606 RepID=UPI00366E1DB1